MKQFMTAAGLLFVGIMAWRLGERLSADAVSLGLGVMLGVVAGLPAALLLLASGRRRGEAAAEAESGPVKSYLERSPVQGYSHVAQGMLPQMPVIVLAGSGMPGQNGYGHGQPQYPALPAPVETIETRQFKVVGEKEEWLDEW
jgi:hypothetical protein